MATTSSMTPNQVKDYVHEHPEMYLAPDKKHKGFVCPICGSGTGIHGTGITTKDNIHFTCWRGCFTHSDILDIIGLQYNVQGYLDTLKIAAEIYGLNMTIPSRRRSPTYRKDE